MPGKKDAAYWAARRKKQKQSAADSGRLQRPRGRAPADMRWDDMRGWTKKDKAPSAGNIGQVSAAAPDPATAESAPPVVPADAPEAETAGTSLAAAPTSPAGRQAANEAPKAAAAVAAAAAADAAAASERAGVTLCRQHARVTPLEDGASGGGGGGTRVRARTSGAFRKRTPAEALSMIAQLHACPPLVICDASGLGRASFGPTQSTWGR